jgi:hypothetical protein
MAFAQEGLPDDGGFRSMVDLISKENCTLAYAWTQQYEGFAQINY